MKKIIIGLCLVGLWASSNHVIAQQAHLDKTVTSLTTSETVSVTWDKFVRAESDKMMSSYATKGAFGKFYHIRAVTPIDEQNVIRMNRDTRYSMGIFDLTNPVTITLPDAGKRFMSMQVINQDEYTKSVLYDSGDYTFTRESIGTRYFCIIIRTLVNGDDEKDNKIVTDLQNNIKVKQTSSGKYEIPNWDKESQDKLRDAINVLASTLTDTRKCFGDVDEVDEIAHLLGAAYGWGGNPAYAAMYLNAVPEKNDGQTPYVLTVKDNVPVDGFWSISVYNEKGYFEQNKYNAYTVSNVTGKKDKDGSIIIHFGGDPGQSNFVPITKGWNYIVRLYRPHKEIINGTYKFPVPVIAN